MNIFYLDENPIVAAQYHNDSHVRKMILEYAQILSTAHRVLDGEEYYEPGKNKQVKRYRLSDERESVLYKATHANHPSTKWARENIINYKYLYELFCALCDEFTYRRGKRHATDVKLRLILQTPPKNISINSRVTQPPQVMSEENKCSDSVVAYKRCYIYEKNHLAVWTRRGTPDWYEKVTA